MGVLRAISSAVLLAAIIVCGAWAAELRAPTIDELVAIERIGSARISPDGLRVAYTVTSADFDGDTFVSQLWVVGTEEKQAAQLTRGKSSVSSVRWSPDGKWIGFLRKVEDGEGQIYLMNPDGGEAFAVTSAKTGVKKFRWSPDASRIAFTAQEPESEAMEARDEFYGEFAIVRRGYRHVHLFSIDVLAALEAPQEGVQETSGKDFSVDSFSWSPDGKRIAFDGTRDPDLVSRHTYDVYVLDRATGNVKKLVENDGPDSDPLWSPDGDEIVFATVVDRTEFFPFNQELAVVSAEGGAARVITESFDENAGLIAWTVEGIYFSGLDKTASHLYRVVGESGAIERVSEPADLMGRSFSVATDGATFAFVADTPQSLPDVFVHRKGFGLPVPLTDMTEQVRDYDLATREVIRWTSNDGTAIEGVLHKPRGFDGTTVVPLLVVIHGGPTGIDRPGLLQGARYYPVDLWTARGALVLRVNYRGSAGYGEAFRRLNVGNLGVGDAWDVESGVEYLIQKGWVDPERVGCMGWSQGGYISAYLTTTSERFAAISVGAGISNWSTYYYNTDITPFTINYLGTDPASDPDIYAKTSPMSYVLGATTPTLIQHGENDKRVPIANAYELRQGLEDRGVPTEMIVYKGFGHGITKPRARRAVLQHNLDWFNHYLWGDALPDWVEPELPAAEED